MEGGGEDELSFLSTRSPVSLLSSSPTLPLSSSSLLLLAPLPPLMLPLLLLLLFSLLSGPSRFFLRFRFLT